MKWFTCIVLAIGVICIISIASMLRQPVTKQAFSPASEDNSTKYTMIIASPVFATNEEIPQIYTCEGKNTNPPLQFGDVPAQTKSLVLLMDDPDVPKNLKPDGVFDHWVVFNMPPTTMELAEATTPPGIQGKNSAGENSYTGPCPPDKEHRYFFKLFALDEMLDLDENASKADVEKAMDGHVIARAQLIGVYNKKNK